jgi:hypothetical protein
MARCRTHVAHNCGIQAIHFLNNAQVIADIEDWLAAESVS